MHSLVNTTELLYAPSTLIVLPRSQVINGFSELREDQRIKTDVDELTRRLRDILPADLGKQQQGGGVQGMNPPSPRTSASGRLDHGLKPLLGGCARS